MLKVLKTAGARALEACLTRPQPFEPECARNPNV